MLPVISLTRMTSTRSDHNQCQLPNNVRSRQPIQTYCKWRVIIMTSVHDMYVSGCKRWKGLSVKPWQRHLMSKWGIKHKETVFSVSLYSIIHVWNAFCAVWSLWCAHRVLWHVAGLSLRMTEVVGRSEAMEQELVQAMKDKKDIKKQWVLSLCTTVWAYICVGSNFCGLRIFTLFVVFTFVDACRVTNTRDMHPIEQVNCACCSTACVLNLSHKSPLMC